MRVLAAIVALACWQGAGDPPPPAADAAPKALTAAQKKEATEAVKAYFTAATVEDRAAALARAEALPGLTPADARWALKLVLGALPVGSRYDGKGEGVIRLAEYPGLEGRYLVSGTKGKARAPLLIGLHGGGQGVGDGAQISQLFGGGPCLSLFPTVMQKDDSAWNQPREEAYVLALLAEACRSFDIDTSRIYLAGHSMGGYGTWSIGAIHADRFAALSAGAGGLFVQVVAPDKFVLPPGHLANLWNTPMWFYHSIDDPKVGPGPDQEANRQLLALREKHPEGYEFVYKEYTNAGHGIPPEGYGPIWKWMLAKTRNPTPKTVVWEPKRATKHQFFWLYWPAPKERRHIEARLTDKNRIEVTGGRISQLSIAGQSRDPELTFTARVLVARP